MAIITTSNASSVKVKFDHGVNINGDRVEKTKTLPSIKPTASNEDIVAVVSAIEGLQKHSVSAINRIDNTSLSE